MVKLVTFDLDNTLWDVDRIIIKAEQQMRGWLEQQVPESLTFYQPETLGELRQEVAIRHADRIHDLSFMRKQVLFEVMQLAGYQESQAKLLAEQAFDVFYQGRNTIEFFPGALQMLEELSHEYTLFALTNGNANINLAGIADYFAGALSSADVGRRKPEPAMFQAALRRFAVPASDAVHIGDHLYDDVHGANNVGMRTIWVNLTDQERQPDDAEPDVEVNDLGQVRSAINHLRQL
ncbi:MAG: HAD family hydrolase [Pseudomonadota bacterium]